MDNVLFDDLAFSEQVRVYYKKYKKLRYCVKCPYPYLCAVCASSIGEALLVREQTNQNKEQMNKSENKKNPPNNQSK